jgi:hypothetical protein
VLQERNDYMMDPGTWNSVGSVGMIAADGKEARERADLGHELVAGQGPPKLGEGREAAE